MTWNSREWIAVGAVAVILFLAALGGAAWLRPQTVQVLNGADAEHSLATTGEAELQVKPDTALVNLGINLKAGDAKGAQSQANERLQAIIAALKAQGVSEDRVRTVNFNLRPEYRYDNGTARLDGYRVYSTVQVTTTELDGVGGLIDAAIAVGANQVESVSFTLKNRNQYKQQAIDLALAEARQKAEASAQKLGTQITGVRHVTINDGGSAPPPIAFDTRAAKEALPAPAGAATPVMPGSFEFRVSVQVEFGLK